MENVEEIYFLTRLQEFQAVSSAVVNVILLPLEGDQMATVSKVDRATWGSFLSPSEDWLK